MDSGFWPMLLRECGGGGWTLAIGGGRVGGIGSNSSMWGQGLEEVDELQRAEGRSDSLVS